MNLSKFSIMFINYYLNLKFGFFFEKKFWFSFIIYYIQVKCQITFLKYKQAMCIMSSSSGIERGVPGSNRILIVYYLKLIAIHNIYIYIYIYKLTARSKQGPPSEDIGPIIGLQCTENRKIGARPIGWVSS